MAGLGDDETFAAEILQRFQSFPEEYQLTGVTQSGRPLGNGAYGVVFDGRWHGARVAIKRPHSMLLRDEHGHLSALGTKFFEEILQHRQLRHPHVAQLLGISPPTPRYESPGLVLEYLPVTLRQRYQSAPPLTALQKADIAAGIASGLSYLHSLSTMHRDLTTNNVMLTSPAAVSCPDGEEPALDIRMLSYVAKITDVGESRNLATGACAQYLTRNPGAQVYMAPETQEGSTQASQRAWYSYSADVYTLGVTVMAMNIGREPPSIYVLARDGRRGDVAAMSAADPMRPIVEQCLQDEPANRPTAADVSARLSDVRERQAALVMAAEAEHRRRRAEQQQQQSDGDVSGGAATTVADAQRLLIERLESDVRALQATGAEIAAEKAQLREANDQLAEFNEQLSNQMRIVEEERDQLSNLKQLAENERDKLTQDKLRVEEEQDLLFKQKQLVEEERDQVIQEKLLVEEERDQQVHQDLLLEKERDQLSHGCGQLSTENQRLTTEVQQFRQERDHLKAESRELVMELITEADRLRADQVTLTDNVRHLTDSVKVLLETGSRADGTPGMVARCQRLFRKPRGELPHIAVPPKWQVAGRLPASEGYITQSETIHNGYLYVLIKRGDQPFRGFSAMRIQLNLLEVGNWEKVHIPGEPFWVGARFFVYGDTLHVLCLPGAADGPHHILKLCDGEWKHVTDLPEKKWEAYCCLHGSHLFVTGGRTSTPASTIPVSACSRSVHSYDLTAVAGGMAWLHWPAVPCSPFNAIPIITTSKQLWVMGCYTDPLPLGCEALSQNWSMDLQKSPESAEWCRQLPDLPASVPCSAVINEEVVVVGGAHWSLKREGWFSSKNVPDKQPPLRDVYMLDKDRSQWLPLPRLNHARWISNVILHEGSIFCIGGNDENNKIRLEIEILRL